MARLLYVEASPRKNRSASIEVSRAFLRAYREHHQGDEIETLDIWAGHYPAFDGAAMAAKYAGLEGTALTVEQQTTWDNIRRLARGLDYAGGGTTPAALFDFQKPYVEAWLRLVGVPEIHSVTVEKTLFGPEVDGAGRGAAGRRGPGYQLLTCHTRQTRVAWPASWGGRSCDAIAQVIRCSIVDYLHGKRGGGYQHAA